MEHRGSVEDVLPHIDSPRDVSKVLLPKITVESDETGSKHSLFQGQFKVTQVTSCFFLDLSRSISGLGACHLSCLVCLIVCNAALPAAEFSLLVSRSNNV